METISAWERGEPILWKLWVFSRALTRQDVVVSHNTTVPHPHLSSNTRCVARSEGRTGPFWRRCLLVCLRLSQTVDLYYNLGPHRSIFRVTVGS